MAANSKVAAAAVIKIKCGNLTGTLHLERFGPAGKSVCIKMENANNNKKLTAENNSNSEWLSPIEFEKLAGKGAQHNWKRTVRSVTHDNKTMYYLLEQGILKQCEEKHCSCSPCSLLLKKGKKFKFTSTHLSVMSAVHPWSIPWIVDIGFFWCRRRFNCLL